MNPAPADAVLLIAFGGPECSAEIRPFLQDVLRGRPVPPSRLEEVAHHYEAIGGRSPLNELTEQQRVALQEKLAHTTLPLPVHVGMRHARPLVVDTLRTLAASGARRVVGVVMASFLDHDTLGRYSNAVNEAQKALALADFVVDYADGPDSHPGFVAANAATIRDAFLKLTAAEQASAELIFTAHSVPTAVGEASGYVARFESAAGRIAKQLGRTDYRLAYQSRSGSPRDPWLGPDIGEVIRDEARQGSRVLVVAPIGFVCDHVEVLYDLDIEAANIAHEHGITMSRARTVTAHPAYIEALADTVLARATPA